MNNYLKVDLEYKEIVDKWNAEVDEHNKWEMLSEEEKVEYAFKLGIMAVDVKLAVQMAKRGIDE